MLFQLRYSLSSKEIEIHDEALPILKGTITRSLIRRLR